MEKQKWRIATKENNMSYLYIKDWDEWQSYRSDRGAPPWIKVHRCLRSNMKWGMLSDAERGQLVSIWILAADNGGKIPNDATFIRKVCALDSDPNLKRFIDIGFMVPEGRQNDVNVTPERGQCDAPEQSRAEQSKKEYTDDFEKVWEKRWSRGSAANPKQLALKAYKAAIRAGAKHDDILQGVIKRVGVSKEGTEYAPQMASWINQRRWEDKAGMPDAAIPEHLRGLPERYIRYCMKHNLQPINEKDRGRGLQNMKDKAEQRACAFSENIE